jgi:chromosome segregation ATPase
MAVAGVAYASPAPTGGSDQTAANLAAKLDPAAQQQAKDKLAELNAIRAQAADLDAQLRTVRQEAATLQREIRGTQRDGTQRVRTAKQEQIQYSQGVVKPLLDHMKLLQTQLREAKKAGNQELVKGLQAQLAAVREQLKAKRQEAQGLGQKLRDLWTGLKAKGETIKTAIAPLKELRDKTKASMTSLLEAQKKLATDRKDAVKAAEDKDSAGALAALDRAVADAKQVVAQKTALVELEKQAGTILKNAVDALKTQSPSPALS